MPRNGVAVTVGGGCGTEDGVEVGTPSRDPEAVEALRGPGGSVVVGVGAAAATVCRSEF